MSKFKKQRYIPELWESYHRKDVNPNSRFNYEKFLLRKSTSEVLWQNNRLKNFMNGLNGLLVHLVDSISLLRNYTNINSEKYFTDYRD